MTTVKVTVEVEFDFTDEYDYAEMLKDTMDSLRQLAAAEIIKVERMETEPA